MLPLSDFVTCRKDTIIRVGGSISHLLTLWEDEIWNIPSCDTNKQNFLCCHG